VKDAIAELQKPGHVKPRLDRFAVVGHSAGGNISASMAGLASSSGLPRPGAVMCIQPGKTWTASERIKIPIEGLDTIATETLLLCVTGEEDRVARDVDAKKIFYGASRVPAANKDFVILRSDDHGEPALKASHFAPAAPNRSYDSGEASARPESGPLMTKIRERRSQGGEEYPDLASQGQGVDALDTRGLWKLFDALCDAAFFGKNREVALGNTPEQRFMGCWSDGRPVTELEVTGRP
jgi:acetyl esterase/lipase